MPAEHHLHESDDFKEINNTRGDYVGDEILIHFATTLRDCLRPEDHVARIDCIKPLSVDGDWFHYFRRVRTHFMPYCFRCVSLMGVYSLTHPSVDALQDDSYLPHHRTSL